MGTFKALRVTLMLSYKYYQIWCENVSVKEYWMKHNLWKGTMYKTLLYKCNLHTSRCVSDIRTQTKSQSMNQSLCLLLCSFDKNLWTLVLSIIWSSWKAKHCPLTQQSMHNPHNEAPSNFLCHMVHVHTCT